MKKILTLVALLIGLNANSQQQWNDGDIAPDFTLSDQFGVQHNLYTQLNSGKVVLLDFSFPACKYCWDDCVEGNLSNLNSAYGKDGSNQIRTYMIDILGGYRSIPNMNGYDTTNQNMSRGDFMHYANYPILNQGDDYGDTMKVIGAPTYMLVCPNKKAYSINDAMLVSEAQNLCSCTLTKTVNNLRIYLPELTTCAGINRVNVFGNLINTGSNNITSARIKLMLNNTVLKSQTINYTGTNNTQATMSLAEFKFDSVLINQPIGIYGKGPYKVIVDMVNGINLTTPFEKIVKITRTQALTSASSLSVQLRTDAFSTQNSWVIYNSKGNVVHQNPAITNNNTITTVVSLANNECYTIRLKDTKGNGIGVGSSLNFGFVKVLTPSNTMLCNLKYSGFNYENFGYDVMSSFQVGSLTSLSNLDGNILPKLSIYPNPTNDKFKVDSEQELTINLMDVTGKKVKEFRNVDKTKWLDISDLEAGCYFAEVNEGENFQPIKIIKK